MAASCAALQAAFQFGMACQLAQHLAGQQQALLVQEDIALVHRPLLVLELEHGGAGGRGLAHFGPRCAAICASDRRDSSPSGNPASSRQPMAMLCSRCAVPPG